MVGEVSTDDKSEDVLSSEKSLEGSLGFISIFFQKTLTLTHSTWLIGSDR